MTFIVSVLLVEGLMESNVFISVFPNNNLWLEYGQH